MNILPVDPLHKNSTIHQLFSHAEHPREMSYIHN